MSDQYKTWRVSIREFDENATYQWPLTVASIGHDICYIDVPLVFSNINF